MNKSERYRAIIEILQREGSVDVNDLAKRFQTSLMTIRRDLNALCEEYNIVRTHGGAMMGEGPMVRVISLDEKLIAHREQKNGTVLRVFAIRHGSAQNVPQRVEHDDNDDDHEGMVDNVEHAVAGRRLDM